MNQGALLPDLEDFANIFHFTIAGIEQDLIISGADPDYRIISALCGLENRLRDIITAGKRKDLNDIEN